MQEYDRKSIYLKKLRYFFNMEYLKQWFFWIEHIKFEDAY